MKKIISLLALLVLAALPLGAQTDLSITDVLPPYRLTANLLANGHFSISTLYTGTSKTLVYQEDGTGNKPVNYTSHIHFKVDDVIFQLPYELNPITRDVPPQHPLGISRLFRDTLAGAPRVNAEMFGVMPDGDTMRFTFTMQPVQRPSGAFIRMSAEVHNTTRRAHSVGVLMLVDTKIGDNDQAPIISAFGYKTVETEFDRAIAPGMPEFWLALEGTPVAPGLTARGNLNAPGLIEPDYFLFGNWKDNTAVAGATGLDLAQWKERRAFNVGYTDSAILLVWDEENMNPGERRLRASTEIGIVDSIQVSFGSGGGGGGIAFGGAGGGGGGAGGGGCLGFDTLQQRTCGDTSYRPYAPDSLQTLYLVTNTGSSPLANVRIAVPALPAGLTVASRTTSVIPAALDPSITGVGTLTLHALPRLNAKTYSLPIALVAGTADTLLRDTICITVAGLLGSLHADSLAFAPLCPGLTDTLGVRVRLKGPRCLDLTPGAMLIGGAPDINQFSVVTPTPGSIPANGTADVLVRYTAGTPGDTHRVKIVVMATEHGLNDDDRDTTIIIRDTVGVRGVSRDAEFVFAGPRDTLDMGAVCIGDTTVRDWLVTNVGGCVLTIGRNYSFENDPLGQFSVANDTSFPIAVARGSDERVTVRFAAKATGTAIARFIIHSDAIPFTDTLIVRGRGDAPAFTLAAVTGAADTLCPGQRFALGIPITNPTACPVVITGVAASDAHFGVDTAGFTLPPNSTRQVLVTGTIDTPGVYTALVTIRSAGAGDSVVPVRVVIASRALALAGPAAFGDVRLGRSSAPQRISILSAGTAAVTITTITVAGTNASEYTYTLPNGERLPLVLAPGSKLDVDITFTPADLEQRRAALIVETSAGTICTTLPPADLTGRGVEPRIDAPRRRLDLGRLCAGRTLDTTIVLRNLGNAPLTVQGLDAVPIAGRMHVEMQGLPAVIQPDSSHAVSVKLAAESLGALDVALRFTSDGTWFTAPDTVVRLSGTGVICGTIWADTVRALVGDRAAIGIHIDAAPLAAADVARLMNESNSRSIDLTLAGDPKLMRLTAIDPTKGMIGGLSAAPAVTAAGATIRLVGGNTGGDLAASDVVAVVMADVLLGDKDRSPLALSVGAFAGGNADLTVRPGQLLEEYCALDRRYVQVNGAIISPVSTPLLKSGALVMYLPEDCHATVTLYNPLGDAVARLYDDPATAGTHRLELAGHTVPAGVYVATLTTERGVATVKILVVE